MKILITAPPKTGKSTLIRHAIDALIKSGVKYCQGVLSAEKLDSAGTRVGFTAVLGDGRSEDFMIKEIYGSNGANSSRNTKTLGPYQVQIKVIEEFVVPYLKKCCAESNTDDCLIYIDEIGRAQAFSSEFLAAVDEIFLHSTQCVLASIVYEDESWSQSFKAYDSVWLVEVTEENRNFLPRILESMFSNDHLFKILSANRQKLVKSFFFELLNLTMFTAAKKLFSNVIKYILDEKIQEVLRSEGGGRAKRCFEVEGDTSRHGVEDHGAVRGGGDSTHPSASSSSQQASSTSSVLLLMERYSCDCPLFNSLAPFAGQDRQVCSHILAIHINSAAP